MDCPLKKCHLEWVCATLGHGQIGPKTSQDARDLSDDVTGTGPLEEPPGIRRPDRRKQAAWLIVVLGGGIVISQWVRVFNDNSAGDVQLHYNFGHRFVTGEFLYDGGHTPYPPFWGMANAPWSFLPRRWAQVLAYPIGVVALAFLIYALDRMTRRTMPSWAVRI